jgi:hypothetical protein
MLSSITGGVYRGVYCQLPENGDYRPSGFEEATSRVLIGAPAPPITMIGGQPIRSLSNVPFDAPSGVLRVGGAWRRVRLLVVSA